MVSFHYKNPREHIKFAKSLRKQAPKPERVLWAALCHLNKTNEIKFRRQHPLKPYVADFACIKEKLIIELDGMSHDTRQMYGAKREQFLRKRGWKIMRFANEDVESNLDGVIATILETLSYHHQPSPNPSRKREGNTTALPSTSVPNK